MLPQDRDQQLKAILDTVADGIITIDAKGTIHSYNPAAAKIFGYSRDEVIGQNVSMLLPEPESSQPAAFLQRQIDLPERRPLGGRLEIEGLRKDGSRVPLELSLSEMAMGGEPMFTGITRDISQRKKAEAETAAVLKELASLRHALDEHCIVAITDIQGKITFVNQQFCTISGYSPEELIGQDHRIVNSGYHTADFIRSLWTTIARGKVWKGELRNRAKDGSYYWVDTTIVPFLNADRKPVQYIAIRTDISELKAAEATLAQKNQELEVSARIDRIGARVMLALNQQDETTTPGADVLRVLAEEAGYRPLAFYNYNEWQDQLVCSASLSLAPETQAKVYRTGEGLVGEAAAQRKPMFIDGNAGATFALNTGVGVLEAATLFTLPLLHRETLLGVIAGASQSPLLERERIWLTQVAGQVAIGLFALRQLQELKDLSRQLNERSRQIENQNLELAHASRMKSEFLAGMSHELRTPLNAILGFSELLKDGLVGELQPRQIDYVTEVYQSGRHLLSLINDILDLSKIEAGKMELEISSVNIRAVVGNAFTIMKERASKDGVQLSVSVDDDLDQVEADTRKLRQIIYNLLSNAVKFTPRDGNVSLSASAHGPDVEFSVQDSGIGIAPEDLQRLFRPFEQLDSGIDRQFEGTGLGLAMVKSLVELHGGSLGVESQPGKGSRFWFRLPRLQAEPAAIRAGDDIAEAPPRAGTNGGARILVVDDDAAALKLARRWLSKAGYSIVEATSCDQAWSVLEQQPPDAILLDTLFPQQPDGWQLLAMLKQTPAYADIPVIIVSIVAEQQRGLSLGAVAVLQKPVAGNDLLRAIEDLGLATGHGHILVVDDDPQAVEHVAHHLEQAGMFVTRTFSGEDALAAAATGAYSLLVLDLLMPDVSGFDVLRRLRANPATVNLPVIVLSAKVLDNAERALLDQSVSAVLSKGDWDEQNFLHKVFSAIRSRQVAPGLEPPSARKKQAHILVIADENIRRDLLRIYLEDDGMRVTLATSATEGASLASGLIPDLIVVDLTTNDPELATGNVYPKGVPILVVVEPDTVPPATATATLSSPLRRHELLATVKRLLAEHAGSRPT